MLSKKQALPLFQRQCLCFFLSVYSSLFTGYSASAASSGSASITSWNLSRMIVWILSRVAELIGCAISRYSPSVALRLGIAINNPFSPSITLISCTTISFFCYLPHTHVSNIHDTNLLLSIYRIYPAVLFTVYICHFSPRRSSLHRRRSNTNLHE